MDNNQPEQVPPQPIPPTPVPAPQPQTPIIPPTLSVPPMPSQKKPMSKLILIIIALLVIICIVAVGVIAYKTVLSSNNASKNQKQQSQTETLSPTPSDSEESPSPTPSPFDIQTAIESAVSNKTYDSLIPYMAESVQFEIEASEGIGPVTPDQAVVNLAYLNNAISPWTFDQADPRMIQIKTQNAQEYESLFIGIASNDTMAAFGTNLDNQINIIKVAANYNLLVVPE